MQCSSTLVASMPTRPGRISLFSKRRATRVLGGRTVSVGSIPADAAVEVPLCTTLSQVPRALIMRIPERCLPSTGYKLPRMKRWMDLQFVRYALPCIKRCTQLCIARSMRFRV